MVVMGCGMETTKPNDFKNYWGLGRGEKSAVVKTRPSPNYYPSLLGILGRGGGESNDTKKVSKPLHGPKPQPALLAASTTSPCHRVSGSVAVYFPLSSPNLNFIFIFRPRK